MAGRTLVSAMVMALVPLAAAGAQSSDITKQIINDPSGLNVEGAKASLIEDSKVQGGKALRVQVARKGAHPWDSTVGGPIVKPIKRGDHLVLLFSARLAQGENGATTATLPYNAIQLVAAPYSTVITGSGQIGPEWKDFQVTGTADANYAAKELKVTVQLATAKQIVEFGPVVVLDTGQ